MTTRSVLSVVLGVVLMGCAPSQPASCPIQTQQREVEQALQKVEASVKTLEALRFTADSLLGGFMTPEMQQQLEDAYEQAEEMRRKLEDSSRP